MKDRIKNIVLPVVMAIFIAFVFVYMIAGNTNDYSESERRVLKKSPELSKDSVFSGKYMSEFEEYALDQFPGRDALRSIKAVFAKDVLFKKDNNNIYVADGYVSKLEYPISYPMLDHASERFEYIYNMYLKKNGIKPYIMIVPDKNYYLAKKNGYLSLDYDKLYDYMYEKTDYMNHIDIRDMLSIEDYYHTDTHWKQECITDVAEHVAKELGAKYTGNFKENIATKSFYGVYYGQSALPLKPDTLTYLTSDVLDKCIVTSYDTGKPQSVTMYNMDKANGKDPYEMFLEGSVAILTVENPSATTDRKLVVFRDSFGSSLTPLLVEDYSKVTLVDIRYVQSSMLGMFVDFKDSDVLFEYSTLLLNSSLGLH